MAVIHHALKPRIKRVPIYAEDLSEGIGTPSFNSTTANGVSPSWAIPGAVRVGVNADIMVPYDWLPRTDIKFYFVYAPQNVGGTGFVYWGIDYALYRDDEFHGGLGLNPARTVRLINDMPPFGVVMKRTTNPVCIPGTDLVAREQIQIAFIRAGEWDTDERAFYLFKVIMEYESYEPGD